MASFKAILTVQENGRIALDSLPFQAGEEVLVEVSSSPTQPTIHDRFPLRGIPYKYERPFDSAIPTEDWYYFGPIVSRHCP